MLEVGKEEKERDRLFRHSVITDYLVYQAWVTKVSAQITIKNKRKPKLRNLDGNAVSIVGSVSQSRPTNPYSYYGYNYTNMAFRQQLTIFTTMTQPSFLKIFLQHTLVQTAFP